MHDAAADHPVTDYNDNADDDLLLLLLLKMVTMVMTMMMMMMMMMVMLLLLIGRVNVVFWVYLCGFLPL